MKKIYFGGIVISNITFEKSKINNSFIINEKTSNNIKFHNEYQKFKSLLKKMNSKKGRNINKMKNYTTIKNKLLSLINELSGEEYEYYNYVNFRKVNLNLFYHYKEDYLTIQDCTGNYCLYNFSVKEN